MARMNTRDKVVIGCVVNRLATCSDRQLVEGHEQLFHEWSQTLGEVAPQYSDRLVLHITHIARVLRRRGWEQVRDDEADDVRWEHKDRPEMPF